MLTISMPPVAAQMWNHQRNKGLTSSNFEVFPSSSIDDLRPTPNMRPRLSLQTTSLPITYGRSTTALAVPSHETATPTVFNTFSNAYDMPLRPSPIVSATTTPRHITPIPRQSIPTRPITTPFGLKSILRNPNGLTLPRRTATINSASPCSTRRLFFPPSKKVTFRADLEEEIVNKEFMARHSDLGTTVEESGHEDDCESEEQDNDTLDSGSVDNRRPLSTRKRKVEGIEIARGRTLTSSGARSRSRRRKKRRWEWTLEAKVLGGEEEPMESCSNSIEASKTSL